MKNSFILVLCLSSSALFAQNGFFLQPEIGGGIGNFQRVSSYYNDVHRNVSSLKGSLEVGYRGKRWEFITGLGYLRTGYAAGYSGIYYGSVPGSDPSRYGQEDISFYSSAYNRHIIAPVKVGYQLLCLNKRLTFAPHLGAEFSYNLPRVFKSDKQRMVESAEHFNYFCHRFGVFGLAELTLEYKVSKRIALTTGLSARYGFTPYLRDERRYDMPQEHDYAALVNLGMRYNFVHEVTDKAVAR